MNILTKPKVKKVLNDLKKIKKNGIWFDDKINKFKQLFGDNQLWIYCHHEGDGEYKSWYKDGQLDIHCFFNKKGKLEGEYKEWYKNGQLNIHCFFNGSNVKNPYKDEYKEWWNNGKLKKHIIFNKDGSVKEKIV